ncbi:hypothetical protein QFC21_000286 [Naganishia friedmannii]|uniref:Uncharacterized protein n=1 Tax=Naganishia friedmannii TaxID=89922 RepID=A0ACC2WC73_9TREE|nr:hypothetical protein QFC21_000286 [Naganishia friedmannii]
MLSNPQLVRQLSAELASSPQTISHLNFVREHSTLPSANLSQLAKAFGGSKFSHVSSLSLTFQRHTIKQGSIDGMTSVTGPVAMSDATQFPRVNTELDRALIRQVQEMSIRSITPMSAMLYSRTNPGPRPYDTMSITHSLRRNLLNSNKKSSYCGCSGLNMTDGEWEVNPKLTRVLGIVHGTREYAQVAYRQAEVELQRLHQAKSTNHHYAFSPVSSRAQGHRFDQEEVSLSDDYESDDSANPSVSPSRWCVLIKGLRQAMEQWKKNAL